MLNAGSSATLRRESGQVRKEAAISESSAGAGGLPSGSRSVKTGLDTSARRGVRGFFISDCGLWISDCGPVGQPVGFGFCMTDTDRIDP